jgi:hypothetical protein
MNDVSSNLETIIQMRNTLAMLNERLTPYSGKVEHQRYLESLLHYKKILLKFVSRYSFELDTAIEKSKKIIDGFTYTDIELIRNQILDGGH